jgi:hypothetical protein
MEPLQERIVEVIAWEEEAKTYMAHVEEKCARLINNDIAVQALDALKEKIA